MVHGSGKSSVYPIRSLNIKSEGLREINIIADFSFEYRKNDLLIILPEPAVYVVQKILTNPTRVPTNKKEKDIRSVRNMLKYIEEEDYHKNKLVEIMSSLRCYPKKRDNKTKNSQYKQRFEQLHKVVSSHFYLRK